MTKIIHSRMICICLTLIFLFLTSCGVSSTAKAYPPPEDAVRAAAEKLGWTLQSNLTSSRQAGQITYTLSRDGQRQVTVNCTSVSEKRLLSAVSMVTMLPEKPEFSWEDWKDVISLIEAMYGSFSEGELYNALSAQDIPEPEIPEPVTEARPGSESLSWEAECPNGYARVRWAIMAGQTTSSASSGTEIRDWRVHFSVTVFESKESMIQPS